MATAAQLEKLIAHRVGVSVSKAHQISQRLRDAGLLSQGNVGVAAPRMNNADAAALLTALVLSPPISQVAELTVGVLAARRTRLSIERLDADISVLEGLELLAHAGTLGEALALVIRNVCEGNLALWHRAGGFDLSLDLFDEGHRATITATRHRDAPSLAILEFASGADRSSDLLVRHSTNVDEELFRLIGEAMK